MQTAITEDQKAGGEYVDNKPGSSLEIEDAEVILEEDNGSNQ